MAVSPMVTYSSLLTDEALRRRKAYRAANPPREVAMTAARRRKLLPRSRTRPQQPDQAQGPVSLYTLDHERAEAEAARATAILRRWERQEARYMEGELAIQGQCQTEEYAQRERRRRHEDRQREAARRLQVLAGRLPSCTL